LTAAGEFLANIEERVDAITFRNEAEWLGISNLTDEVAMSEPYLDELSGRRRGAVRLSPPMPVVAESSEEALELLIPDLLIEPTTRVFKRLTKQQLRRDMRNAYLLAGIADNFIYSRSDLTVGRSRQFHSSADLVVANDDHAVQLCNAWSFQVGDLEEVGRSIQAWGWNMRELQEYGGFLDDGRMLVPRNVDLQVVVAPDTSSEGRKAFDNASLVFEELKAAVVPYADRQKVAESALKLVGQTSFWPARTIMLPEGSCRKCLAAAHLCCLSARAAMDSWPIVSTIQVTLEIRTVAGPSSVVQ
jgi:hypothetical protein